MWVILQTMLHQKLKVLPRYNKLFDALFSVVYGIMIKSMCKMMKMTTDNINILQYFYLTMINIELKDLFLSFNEYLLSKIYIFLVHN